MDNFRFITNITNPCGGGPTMDEYVEKVLKEAAGVAAPEKSDSKEPDKEKGQVINSEGEEGVTNDPKMPEDNTSKKSDTKKTDDTEDDAKDKEDVKEAAGKAKAEDEDGEGIPISLDADEEFQKGESVDGSKVTPDNKKTEAKRNSTKVKSAAKKCKECDCDPCTCKTAAKKCEKCDCDPCECDEKACSSASASKWMKISNLNPKEKKMLRSFWLTQYPREYVDAMIQDR